jgi:hypothetical protein
MLLQLSSYSSLLTNAAPTQQLLTKSAHTAVTSYSSYTPDK